MADVLGLRALVAETIEAFVEHHAPQWRLPTMFGGHIVGPDAVADVAFTLGWLHETGVHEVAGTPVIDAIRTVFDQLDGPATHTFFSYRVAETIARFGRFDDNNPLLVGLSEAQLANLAAACDSSEVLELIDLLPRNYLAVLSRCELGRDRLGLLDDRSELDRLLAATAAMLGENPKGYLDDSQDRDGRYDIYTADLYLFCEPLAAELGEVWERGVLEALALVRAVASSDGTAVGWGRSTGVLAAALGIELAALAHAERDRFGIDDATARWWSALAGSAVDGFAATWFGTDGVITAHQHRDIEAYRGPQRRLQLTFDVLGKLAEAAARFAAVSEHSDIAVVGAPRLGHRNDLVRFDDRSAVWSYRDDRLEFVMPFVAGPSSDYAPSPRRPGVFGSPVDSTFATFVPLVHRAGNAITPQRRFAPAGAPVSIEQLTDEPGVVVRHDGYDALHPIDDPASCDPIAAQRIAKYRVRGSRIDVAEQLRFDEVPDAVSILVPSIDRPLSISTGGPAGVRVQHSNVDGMHEWAGPWGPAHEVIELVVEPSNDIEFTWSVEPIPVVTVTDRDHHYVREVYGSVDAVGTGRLRTLDWGWDDRVGHSPLGDVFHLQWPEWAFGLELDGDQHRAIADAIHARGTKIAWTQHNLTPHLDNEEFYDPIYQAWASACDLAIHHSHWGQQVVTDRYEFSSTCRHVVIPHPHFASAMGGRAPVARDEAARRLGLDSTPAIRIGVIGAPRRQKHVNVVIDAVHQSPRDDIELVIWGLGFDDHVPDDPRIIAHHYDNVDRSVYDLRLDALDVVALPFIEHTMLATGTASDLVAIAKPALISDWPYLVEYLGDAAIPAGQHVESWTAAIDSLDRSRLDAAASATAQRRDALDSNIIGADTADAIVELLGPLSPSVHWR